VHNELPEATTVHWHGMHLPLRMDGGPHQPIAPGATWSPEWTVDQPAATLWYHPHPHGSTASHVYRGLAGLFITFGLLMTITGAMSPVFGLMIGLMGAAIGFIAPDFVINNRIRSRRDLMRADLPNVLDLLCVSVEAGLGFDQALSKLSERMEGPLVDEFSLVLHEMRIGQSRSAALKNLSERVDAPEVSQFARAIIQADQLGIALSRILRVQSQDMRVRRQLAAEEKAMKAPVKMLFPTVIFIFPSMFVVALGPAALNLMKTFAGG